ncbi:hypothetical protein LXA43DRAFT_1022816 [Ganoderma leucocontextum]|nr:hypothetical protein LXA43DRAFT_1022816 [Ganoderma leucocontextum]
MIMHLCDNRAVQVSRTIDLVPVLVPQTAETWARGNPTSHRLKNRSIEMNPYITSSTPIPVSPLVSHATTPYPQTTAQQAATIQPGSITYTTTVGADGQVVYHPFKYAALYLLWLRSSLILVCDL